MTRESVLSVSIRHFALTGVVLASLTLTTGCPSGGPGDGGGTTPSIGLSPTSLTFTAYASGANPADQTVQVTNAGVDALEWSVMDNATWLSVAPTEGTTTTETDALTVSVDITGLAAAGSPYTGQITISAAGADNSPRTVTVTLNLTAVVCGSLSGTISTDTTLSEPCYIVEGDLAVDDGATLTINPGATLRFQQGYEMTVASTGRLSAVGTASQPIVFTGEEAIRGYWGGLRFYQSNSTVNRLEHVTIEYGGGWWEADLYLTGTSSAPTRIAIVDCTLRESETVGVYIDEEVVISEFSGNTITANTSGAGNMASDVIGYLDDTSTYAGNDEDVVRVWSSTVSTDQTWPGIDADYLVAGDIRVSAALTIAPGARLVFQSGWEMTVDSDGQLSAVGTATEPVVLTGEEPTPGYWGGLRFYLSNAAGNQLDYVTIEYGGGYWEGDLLLAGASSSPTRIKITNCTLRESSQYGLSTTEYVSIDEFAGNTLTANALGAANMPSDGVGSLDDSSTYAGNDVDGVRIWGSAVSTDQTWPGIDADYLVAGDIRVSAALTIAPGARLVFQSGWEMTVDSDGQLSAVGTATEPIVLTGEEPTPGYWGGLRFYLSNAAGNQLDHVTIEYGGGYWEADLYIVGTSSLPTQLTVTNCTIQHSETWGIYLDQYADVNEDIEDANTFVNNASGDVRRPS